MRLSPEEKALCKTNLKFFTEASKTGKDFVDLCRKIIVRHKLDVLVADPLLSYVGGDLSKQEVCSHFLRNLVQPVLQETGCIMVFIHHEGSRSHRRPRMPRRCPIRCTAVSGVPS